MKTSMKHYYGNLVRIIFVVGAVFMVIGLPTMTRVLNIPVVISIAGVVVLVLAAGFTNPVAKASLVANTVISVVYTIVCAYTVWYLFDHPGVHKSFLFANQLATIAFLIATYFAVKSWRGAMIEDVVE